jgi:aldose 1-epimerase
VLDDAYTVAGELELALAGGGRRVVLRADEHYGVAQVFAPEGRDHVALEPMTAPVNALVTGDHRTVRGDEVFAATFTVTVEPDS